MRISYLSEAGRDYLEPHYLETFFRRFSALIFFFPLPAIPDRLLNGIGL